MRSRRLGPHKTTLAVRIGLLAVLACVLSGWTCSAIFRFDSCFDTVSQPQIISLRPSTIPSHADSVVLIVNGSDFISQSQILWNGNALQTTFVNSQQLQAIISPQVFDSFGGSAGSSVQISVLSPRSSVVVGCSTGWTSGIFVVFIN
jgi:hypothetical protein